MRRQMELGRRVFSASFPQTLRHCCADMANASYLCEQHTHTQALRPVSSALAVDVLPRAGCGTCMLSYTGILDDGRVHPLSRASLMTPSSMALCPSLSSSTEPAALVRPSLAAGLYILPSATLRCHQVHGLKDISCLLYTSQSPRDVEESRMPSSA